MELSAEVAELRLQAESLLLQSIRVELLDGRFVVGRLECFDSSCNIVLSAAEEYAPIENLSPHTPTLYDTRRIGLIMIPGPKVRRVFHKTTTRSKLDQTLLSCII
uniref:Sm domain-containing protein n=1 Tax=Erythrolobus madagascarensis TaxID=708628 RepID=A0A7S0XNJ3_9RHOD|mmetsp:Transcript_4263/g.9291  ORF Transcript_4263/g.9291 Transcript_4263/m.9291 type:complete len:105 (+) Transcript_4263:27-341(+)